MDYSLVPRLLVGMRLAMDMIPFWLCSVFPCSYIVGNG